MKRDARIEELSYFNTITIHYIAYRKGTEVEIFREREQHDDKSRDFESELGAPNASLMGDADDAEVSR